MLYVYVCVYVCVCVCVCVYVCVYVCVCVCVHLLTNFYEARCEDCVSTSHTSFMRLNFAQ
jgi:hypothetical protein